MKLMGLSQIMRRAFAGDDLVSLTQELTTRIERDASDAAAMLDLATVWQIRGQADLAVQLQWQALQRRQHYTFAHSPARPTLRLLAIMGPGDVMSNMPVEFLIENDVNGDMAIELLYLGDGLAAPSAIPAHDIAVVAVCESDQNRWLLAQLGEVMKHWPRPYINHPSSIARLGREEQPHLLAGIPGIVVSQAERMHREDLEGLLNFADYPSHFFPVIARPLGSHAGIGLKKLNQPGDVLDYLQSSTDEEFTVAPFIDYASADGKYRKFRVVMIDGQALAAHMAVSSRWMVHYLNADMLDNAQHRAEEAEFMLKFDQEFAVRHRVALANIDRAVKLDYYSIDCAEMRSGELVVFEVDSGAVVHSMDPVEKFPYKPPQMRKVFSAFRNLVTGRTSVAKAA